MHQLARDMLSGERGCGVCIDKADRCGAIRDHRDDAVRRAGWGKRRRHAACAEDTEEDRRIVDARCGNDRDGVAVLHAVAL